MENDRLWKFTKPEWLNSIWARNAGVYSSGALVGLAQVPWDGRLVDETICTLHP